METRFDLDTLGHDFDLKSYASDFFLFQIKKKICHSSVANQKLGLLFNELERTFRTVYLILADYNYSMLVLGYLCVCGL